MTEHIKPACLVHLLPEILEIIMTMLDGPDIIHLRLCSKSLRDLTYERSVWRAAYQDLDCGKQIRDLPQDTASMQALDYEYLTLSHRGFLRQLTHSDITMRDISPGRSRSLQPTSNQFDEENEKPKFVNFTLVPGGRFLVTYNDQKWVELWDFGLLATSDILPELRARIQALYPFDIRKVPVLSIDGTQLTIVFPTIESEEQYRISCLAIDLANDDADLVEVSHFILASGPYLYGNWHTVTLDRFLFTFPAPYAPLVVDFKAQRGIKLRLADRSWLGATSVILPTNLENGTHCLALIQSESFTLYEMPTLIDYVSTQYSIMSLSEALPSAYRISLSNTRSVELVVPLHHYISDRFTFYLVETLNYSSEPSNRQIRRYVCQKHDGALSSPILEGVLPYDHLSWVSWRPFELCNGYTVTLWHDHRHVSCHARNNSNTLNTEFNPLRMWSWAWTDKPRAWNDPDRGGLHRYSFCPVAGRLCLLTGDSTIRVVDFVEYPERGV